MLRGLVQCLVVSLLVACMDSSREMQNVLPEFWFCDEELYNDGLKCDCGCGAPDPDCDGTQLWEVPQGIGPDTSTSLQGYYGDYQFQSDDFDGSEDTDLSCYYGQIDFNQIADTNQGYSNYDLIPVRLSYANYWRFNQVYCDAEFSICKGRTVPTSRPTIAPTTLRPTPNPTRNPTPSVGQSTPFPTTSPPTSSFPTSIPTVQPTGTAETSFPTSVPTLFPTIPPIEIGSTSFPSSQPTQSLFPTASPSRVNTNPNTPTPFPTAGPTSGPTTSRPTSSSSFPTPFQTSFPTPFA